MAVRGAGGGDDGVGALAEGAVAAVEDDQVAGVEAELVKVLVELAQCFPERAAFSPWSAIVRWMLTVRVRAITSL